jgi:Rrf2 family cysteine metabolism transcriptional repressor
LGEVIRFIDGPIEPVACVRHNYEGCQDINRCIFRNIWKRVADSTSLIIDSITFADLVKKVKSSKSGLIYQI